MDRRFPHPLGSHAFPYARRNEVRDRLSQAGAAVVDSVAEVALQAMC
jgi:hypothetical protein